MNIIVNHQHDDDEDHHHHHQMAIVPIMNLENLNVIAPLGRGAKGVVFLVKDEQQHQQASSELWALKVILRDLVESKSKELISNSNNNNNNDDDGKQNPYRRISFEQQLLSRFKHPLLPRLRGVLSTEKIVAYAIDYCPGRDLNSLRKQQTESTFSTDFIRFYGAELVLALEHLHNLGIAYRDLKPENILIQHNGHIMLVDYDLSTRLKPKPKPKPKPLPNSLLPPPTTRRRTRGFSAFRCFCSSGISPERQEEDDVDEQKWSPAGAGERSNSFVGTEEYVAPEIIQGYGHDFAVDWWSLGVVLYEMLYGVTPFKGASRKESFYRILTRSPDLVGEPTPLRDLIGKLLVKDPKQRITVEGIKAHNFFKGLDWDKILKVRRPPYIPLPPDPLLTCQDRDEDENEDGKGNNNILTTTTAEGIKKSKNNNNNNRTKKKKIDVEYFVQGIFASNGKGSGNGNKNKNNNNDNNNKIDKNGGDHQQEQGQGQGQWQDEAKATSEGMGTEKGTWVNGLNNPPCETENFLVF